MKKEDAITVLCERLTRNRAICDALSMAISALAEKEHGSNPLTLEELENVEFGAPLWLELGPKPGGYALLLDFKNGAYRFVNIYEEVIEAPEKSYGAEWVVYRREPEEAGNET